MTLQFFTSVILFFSVKIAPHFKNLPEMPENLLKVLPQNILISTTGLRNCIGHCANKRNEIFPTRIVILVDSTKFWKWHSWKYHFLLCGVISSNYL